MTNTLYWHDYETFGTDPRFDRPVQFAGIRTDEDLNIVGDPLMIFCQLAEDALPHPEACLITGITPQQAQREGVNEAEFIARIHQELAEPGTCGVGYNSLRFDDEFTRYTLFRNFYDAYAREWQNGNSRWDIIDMVRLTRALRPEGIEWPDREDGNPSFRLEDLTAANRIEHVGAHDALVDVYATINLAKLIKQQQPKLYDFVYQNRRKQAIAPLLNLRDKTPVIHVSRMYPSQYCGTAMVVPLARDPYNNNGIIVYDLRHDPSDLLELDAAELRERLFTASDALPEGVKRPALKTVHINKCPVIVPVNTLDDAAAERLQIDRQQHHQHLEMLRRAGDLTEKLEQIFVKTEFEALDDPDASLYSGGFFSDRDKNKMAIIREATPEQLRSLTLPFDDPRLGEMLLRYRARNWPHSLSTEEQEQWQQFRQQRLLQPATDKILSLTQYFEAINHCRDKALSERQQQVLDDLEQYGQQIKQSITTD